MFSSNTKCCLQFCKLLKFTITLKLNSNWGKIKFIHGEIYTMSRWGRLLNINLLTEDYRVAVLIRNTISFFLVLDNGTSWEDGGWRSLISARKISSFRLINIGKIVNELVISSAITDHLDLSLKHQIFVTERLRPYIWVSEMLWRGEATKNKARLVLPLLSVRPFCPTGLIYWDHIIAILLRLHLLSFMVQRCSTAFSSVIRVSINNIFRINAGKYCW